jgi:hypothetical protein
MQCVMSFLAIFLARFRRRLETKLGVNDYCGIEVIIMMAFIHNIIAIVGLICLIVTSFVVVGIIFFIVVGLILSTVDDNRFARQMRAAGRYLAWNDVAMELERGHGTLVIDWIFPNGRLREWWVPDDIISLAPTSIPKWDGKELPYEECGPLGDYARHCVLKYIDPVYGTAKLTKLPWRGIESILMRCRVATLMRCSDNPEKVGLVLGHVFRER